MTLGDKEKHLRPTLSEREQKFVTVLPRAPLPPWIYSMTPGTWSHSTMTDRIRTSILSRVFIENDFPTYIIERLMDLDVELQACGDIQIAPIENDGGPDIHVWNQILLKDWIQRGCSWLSTPWLIAEFYFYRRLMTAVDYWKTGADPFERQKQNGLCASLEEIGLVAKRFEGLMESEYERKALEGFILTALWGNKMDLSLWPQEDGNGEKGSVGKSDEGLDKIIEAGIQFMLVDDMLRTVEYVEGLRSESKIVSRGRRMDVVVDNAGFELFTDLCLADYLIMAKLADTVVIQLKGHPVFVSDAMRKDVMYTITVLSESTDEDVKTLGVRWQQHIDRGNWILHEHLYWAQPFPFWEMDRELRDDLRQSNLIVVKGDCNYRRCLGDRVWDMRVSFDDVMNYFPAPVMALRVLKAEIGCGMDEDKMISASQEDENWLTSGRYGVVQFLAARAPTE
eukprot:Plantae.Rhodophyta-Hildenbrandia_rubra.ctg5883.p1 GENE.Plantae.Rhodophyta-Hildenbrandia_rubra.ctg5883~~Plantae.Rhodophyta-Hildenbrandia_rubra.ctg5883.p1  ORF type:complete len:452 (+),score=74.03 Plantae.Rhodophyta-Hildenbrandia_rubra.ctg5883:270-1625(+)